MHYSILDFNVILIPWKQTSYLRRCFRWWRELNSANYHFSIERSSFFKLDLLKERCEWNLREGPNIFFSRYKRMIFRSWNQLSYSLCTHDIGRLVNLFRKSIFFRPPSLTLLQIFLCFISGLVLFHKKKIWVVSKALIMWRLLSELEKLYWYC